MNYELKKYVLILKKWDFAFFLVIVRKINPRIAAWANRE
jgi:hypothetical protein